MSTEEVTEIETAGSTPAPVSAGPALPTRREGVLRQLYRGKNAWSFHRASRFVVVLSGVAILICAGALIFRGLNLGIEFEGGSVWEIPVASDEPPDEEAAEPVEPADAPGDAAEPDPAPLAGIDATTDEVAEAARLAGVADPRVQLVNVPTGQDIFRIRGAIGEDVAPTVVTTDLAERVGIDVDAISSRQVSASFGGEVAAKARTALIVFFILISLYLWMRFEWKMSLGALVAVAHDIILTVGVYAVFGFEVTPATVVAFLTIMGYSLYDTIVVFDRVKDNERRMPARSHVTYPSLADFSLNQVVMRSINTSITSMLPILALLVVGAGLMGASALGEFAVALFVGIAVGSYSSLFVAMPFVVALKVRERGWKHAQQTAEEMGRRGGVSDAVEVLAASSYSRNAPPRPRRRRRR